MLPSKRIQSLGQSLWLDNITRELLNSGTLARYIDELGVTGLTSNPTIFDHAIKNSLALEHITRAADLFLPVHKRTDDVDGWVSLEVSPLPANDTKTTIEEARSLHLRAARGPTSWQTLPVEARR
jgi:transaldolase